MTKPLHLVLLLMTAALPARAAPAPSPLALSCTGCHQASVNSPAMPALDRMTPAALEASLKAARDTPQTGSVMARFVAKMSDTEIAQLAAELGRAEPAARRSKP